MLPLRRPATAHSGFPLSHLIPTAHTMKLGEQLKTVLRHPRSRIRISPGWRAPSISVHLKSAEAMVFASKHRISTVMWEKITGSPAPEQEALFLVTLSAMVDEDSLRGSVPSVSAEIHSLFRTVTGESWMQQEHDPEKLTWTWNCLVTAQDLQRPAVREKTTAA